MSTIGMKRLTARQQELLAQVAVVHNTANFTGSQIADWPALKTVMIALGGKWKSRVGFEFPPDVDALEMVRVAREQGAILDPKEADFYETPAELVERVCDAAELAQGMMVLEPSAGQGALAVMAKEGYGCDVYCVEALPKHRAILKKHGLPCIQECDDFLQLGPPEGLFDRVVMNPPFSKRADIRHVTHALAFLKPGGILVAIMSAAVRYRDDRIGTEFRQLVQENRGTITDNPDGSFKRAGTMVRTCMVKMRKAG